MHSEQQAETVTELDEACTTTSCKTTTVLAKHHVFKDHMRRFSVPTSALSSCYMYPGAQFADENITSFIIVVWR